MMDAKQLFDEIRDANPALHNTLTRDPLMILEVVLSRDTLDPRVKAAVLVSAALTPRELARALMAVPAAERETVRALIEGGGTNVH